MLDRTDDVSTAAENWFAQFEHALAKRDERLLKSLFHPDSYWRDVLALTWHIRTVNGADAIAARAEGACRPRRAAAVSGSTPSAPRRAR